MSILVERFCSKINARSLRGRTGIILANVNIKKNREEKEKKTFTMGHLR